jgi:zinc protease
VQAGGFPMNFDKAGMFAFFCIANQGVEIERMQKAVEEEVQRVKNEGITEEEFQKVRNQKEAQFTRSFMSLDSKLRNLAQYSLFYGDTKLVNEEIKKYMAVTRDDIKRVANTYLQPQRRNTVTYVVMDKN